MIPNTIIQLAAVAIISYLLGSLNFSIIVSNAFAKKDIRKSGSGNAGATNMLRTYGKKFAALTMLGDIIKVAAAIAIAFVILKISFSNLFIADKSQAQTVIIYKEFAGLFCVIGHIFPVFFKFKGGKGVAACTGMVILVDWRIALILFAVFIILVMASKWISLGSVTIAVLYPLMVFLFYSDLLLTLIAVLFAVIVLVAHRENIKRILKGTENKISFSK